MSPGLHIQGEKTNTLYEYRICLINFKTLHKFIIYIFVHEALEL